MRPSPSPKPWRRRACGSATSGSSTSGAGRWRVEVGIANAGWLPTYVSARAKKLNLVLPIVAELVGDGATVLGGPARLQLGQLEGASASRFTWPNDAIPRPRAGVVDGAG